MIKIPQPTCRRHQTPFDNHILLFAAYQDGHTSPYPVCKVPSDDGTKECTWEHLVCFIALTTGQHLPADKIEVIKEVSGVESTKSSSGVAGG